MDIESAFSRSGSIKGIAVELPFLKFKYLKVESGASEQAAQRRIDTVVNNGEERRTTPRSSNIQIVQPAQIKTLGVDPMVSSASVIHELAFGRLEDAPAIKRPDTKYYRGLETNQSQLNIIV